MLPKGHRFGGSDELTSKSYKHLGAVMKKFLVSTTALVALAGIGSASAADLPVKAPSMAPVVAPLWSWTGFYVGISGGYGWSHTTVVPTATGTQTGVFGDAPAILATQLAGIVPVDVSSRGGLFGVQAGFNYQFNQFVVGVEADYSWAHINGSSYVSTNRPVNFPYGFPVSITTTVAGSQSLESLGTLRGRLPHR